jgi:hypothetical protein
LDVKNISEGGDILTATGKRALRANSTSAQYFTLQIKIKKLDEKMSKHAGLAQQAKWFWLSIFAHFAWAGKRHSKP